MKGYNDQLCNVHMYVAENYYPTDRFAILKECLNFFFWISTIQEYFGIQ